MTSVLAATIASDNGAKAQQVLGATTTNNTNYLPWILGALAVVVIVGVVVFFVRKSSQNN